MRESVHSQHNERGLLHSEQCCRLFILSDTGSMGLQEDLRRVWDTQLNCTVCLVASSQLQRETARFYLTRLLSNEEQRNLLVPVRHIAKQRQIDLLWCCQHVGLSGSLCHGGLLQVGQ